MSNSYWLEGMSCGDMLKKNIIFFKCLKSGYTKPNCKNSIKCYKCKKEGYHHTV